MQMWRLKILIQRMKMSSLFSITALWDKYEEFGHYLDKYVYFDSAVNTLDPIWMFWCKSLLKFAKMASCCVLWQEVETLIIYIQNGFYKGEKTDIGWVLTIRVVERTCPIRPRTGPRGLGPNGPDRTGPQILRTSIFEVLVLPYADRGPNGPVRGLFIFSRMCTLFLLSTSFILIVTTTFHPSSPA